VLGIIGASSATINSFSRLWCTLYFALGFGLLFGFRVALRWFLRIIRSYGRNSRQIIIIGAGDLATNTLQTLQQLPWVGIQVQALFDDDLSLQNTKLFSVPVAGDLTEVVNYVQTHEVDEIWFALPFSATPRVKEIYNALNQLSTPVEMRLIPDIFSFKLFNHDMFEVAGIPIISLSQTPISGVNRILKEIEDKLFASIILLMISPLLLAISIGIKLTSRGPVLFKQLRHGWGGEKITVYKFRTMIVHEEKNGCVTQAKKQDSRITKFGSFLRRTSLDELPQFINVLQGRMSIVGPRPHAVQHNEIYRQQIDSYMLRHRVKPGITGWAQVSGWRGEIDSLDKMEKRIEYDFYYINNWSVLFDLKIIFLTVLKGMINKNAY
jgi:putative colanic acid biosynthesis UDP-glucose lipid carrier transferase